MAEDSVSPSGDGNLPVTGYSMNRNFKINAFVSLRNLTSRTYYLPAKSIVTI